MTTVACKTIGAVIAALGALRILGFVMNRKERRGWNLLPGMLFFIVGIWIFFRPESIQNMLLIGIGVVLFVHGFEDLRYAFQTRRGGYDNWWALLLFAIVGMALGIACIADSFGMVSVVLAFVGAALIYDGVTDLWIISRVIRIEKALRQQREETEMPEAKLLSEEEVEVVTEESELWKK